MPADVERCVEKRMRETSFDKYYKSQKAKGKFKGTKKSLAYAICTAALKKE